MAKKNYDVIIVGGGPAGSTCGIFLKKLNPSLHVCIIDKAHFPKKKSCGDGLSPCVADIIREAGISDFFIDKKPISVFHLVCSGTIDLKYDLRNMEGSNTFGYVFPREAFDAKLVQHAKELSVDFYEDHEIIEIKNSATFFTTITCKRKEGNADFAGKIIVGADGAHSLIRKYLQLRPNNDKHEGIALRYYCNIDQCIEPFLRIDILKRLKNSYGWVFPVSDTIANIGLGVDVDIFKKKKINLNHEFDRYLSLIKGEFNPQPIPGTRSGYPLPYGSQLSQLVHGNKVLIGDAASMINPLTGEGIYYGMSAGKMLAEKIATSFHSDNNLEKALLTFSDGFMNNYKNHYRLNLKIKKLLSTPLSGFLLKRVAQDKKALNKVMGVIMGNSSHLHFTNFSFRTRLKEM